MRGVTLFSNQSILCRVIFLSSHNNTKTFSRDMKRNIKDDATLLRLLHTDRAAGFRALFDAYYTPLCLFSLQYTDDFAVSEDIVQTFFVSFWEQRLHTRVSSNLRYYMFSAIRNNTLAYLRHNGDAQLLPLDEALLDDSTLQDLIDLSSNEALLAEREAKLRQALDALSPQEREALQQVVVNEGTYKDAAATMGISVNTLKTHLRRAMKKLRTEQLCLLLLGMLNAQ